MEVGYTHDPEYIQKRIRKLMVELDQADNAKDKSRIKANLRFWWKRMDENKKEKW